MSIFFVKKISIPFIAAVYFGLRFCVLKSYVPLRFKELLTNSSAKDCDIFFVTKRRNFEVIVDTITKNYNEFVIKKSHKI